MTKELTDYQRRQRANTQIARLDPMLIVRLEEYGKAHQMSKSEVIRTAVQRYMEGSVTVPRRNYKVRVNFWMRPHNWTEFTRKAKQDRVSVTDALEAALEELL